ncbi:pseudouridylate synthase TRUB2, mitochondrial-like isoform X2 [Oratosquilla oratoria]|uniref:pseudouridylate synthase TRUB2, mitochondrial-like isoform X2 n=1 Tax=Oratosquilla oratoria TaxID=337810 RepID=UPI003F761CC3
MARKTIRLAPEAWEFLNGVFCVYKPADMTMHHMRKVLLGNLCRDLNALPQRPNATLVSIQGSLAENNLVVKEELDYSDHPLVSGPRYQPNDFRLSWGNYLKKIVSGLCLVGINNGAGSVKHAQKARLIKTYTLSGQFGRASDDFSHEGKIVEKSKWGHVTRGKFEKMLMLIQASHQRMMLDSVGLDLQSQEIYDLLSQGTLIRPADKASPLLYSIKQKIFSPPDFTIEVACIGEDGTYLQALVNEIGLLLKTNAVCTGIRCIRFGPWTLDHALLQKHWQLQHILPAITHAQPLIKNVTPHSASVVQNQQSLESE